MGAKSKAYEDGVEEKTFLDSFIDVFNSSINNEINNLTNTAKDLLAGNIKEIIKDKIVNTGLGRAISFFNDYYEFSKAVKEVDTIASSDESDYDKIYGIANLGKDLLKNAVLEQGLKMGIEAIVKSAYAPEISFAVTALAISAASAYKNGKNLEKIEESDQFTDEFKTMIFDNGWGLYFPVTDKDVGEKSTEGTNTGFNQYIEDKLNAPIWKMKIPLGAKLENKFFIEEDVAGFDEKLLLNKNAAIWKMKIPSDEKLVNNFLPEQDVAGFDEAIRLNKDQHIWIIKIPSIPSDNFISDESDSSEDIFDGEDFVRLKNMIGEGSVLNHYTIAPNLSFNGTNVTQSLDIKLIMAQLEKAIKKEIETTPEGVYRK